MRQKNVYAAIIDIKQETLNVCRVVSKYTTETMHVYKRKRARHYKLSKKEKFSQQSRACRDKTAKIMLRRISSKKRLNQNTTYTQLKRHVPKEQYLHIFTGGVQKAIVTKGKPSLFKVLVLLTGYILNGFVRLTLRQNKTTTPKVCRGDTKTDGQTQID